MPKVKIIVGNSKSRITGDLGSALVVRDALKIRSKGYFFSPAYRSGNWDGYIRYVTETGIFKTGLLDQVIAVLDSEGIKWNIEDQRENFSPVRELESIGAKEFWEHQQDSIHAFLNNTLHGIPFRRGIVSAATNAGKSVITAGIIGSFSKKRISLVLVNNKDLYDQTLKDLKELYREEVGQVNSKITDWRRINVCMVQTLGLRLTKIPEYRQYLSQVSILIVDEADELIGRKDCINILNHCYDATIRLAMTGTALKNKPGRLKDRNLIHKGSTRNQDQLAYFGPILYDITNKELVDAGVSTKPNIKFTPGNKSVSVRGDYVEEYKRGIILNKGRNKRIWKSCRRSMDQEKLPMLIVFKNHRHGKEIMKRIPEDIKDRLKVEMIHGKTKNRAKALEDFKDGKIDVLVASLIIKRGINAPLIKHLLNAAGGDSETAILQILGRALRKHESKKEVLVEDFWDEGAYLKRHSKHRLDYYKKQGFDVTLAKQLRTKRR